MKDQEDVFREFCIILAFLLVGMVLLGSGCAPSVRDKAVYQAEIAFVEDAAEEQVERGIALINSMCKCEYMMGERFFTTEVCADLAETILVVQYRLKYHTEFMRYLGGINAKRPPKNPPEVPETNSLCPQKNGLFGKPMSLPEELCYDGGVGDSGADGGRR